VFGVSSRELAENARGKAHQFYRRPVDSATNSRFFIHCMLVLVAVSAKQRGSDAKAAAAAHVKPIKPVWG
jgi:hypothetical protein